MPVPQAHNFPNLPPERVRSIQQETSQTASPQTTRVPILCAPNPLSLFPSLYINLDFTTPPHLPSPKPQRKVYPLTNPTHSPRPPYPHYPPSHSSRLLPPTTYPHNTECGPTPTRTSNSSSSASSSRCSSPPFSLYWRCWLSRGGSGSSGRDVLRG